MDRRKSLKVLAIGSIGGVSLLSGCVNKADQKAVPVPGKKELYGRTPEEAAHDEALLEQKFFTGAELVTVGVLCDIIIPADEHSGSATDAKVPEFIDFTMKDRPELQTAIRGGLKWLDLTSMKMFGVSFAKASKTQQLELVELIAYPEKTTAGNRPGTNFFTTMRNLTATGFFTSKIGIEDLQYKGNVPNTWDGVPDDVLKQYGLSYDEKTLAQCFKAEDKGKMMVWD